MAKQLIQVKGMQLAYEEKNAEADKTIFFMHGNSGSSLRVYCQGNAQSNNSFFQHNCAQ